MSSSRRSSVRQYIVIDDDDEEVVHHDPSEETDLQLKADDHENCEVEEQLDDMNEVDSQTEDRGASDDMEDEDYICNNTNDDLDNDCGISVHSYSGGMESSDEEAEVQRIEEEETANMGGFISDNDDLLDEMKKETDQWQPPDDRCDTDSESDEDDESDVIIIDGADEDL